MKKTIKYGIFAEDEAHKIFMKNAIPQLVEYLEITDKAELVHEESFTKFVLAKNGDYVRANFIATVEHGVERYDLDLCFVGMDADDYLFEDLFKEMFDDLDRSELDNNKVLIYIPVQAMEYWLWYIKVKAEDATLQKTPPIETENRKDMKKKVYNRIKPTNTKSNPIVESLSNSFDINWLRQCSDSFDAFAKEFENYIKKL